MTGKEEAKVPVIGGEVIIYLENPEQKLMSPAEWLEARSIFTNQELFHISAITI